jgi:RND family efflux transporter MFP subunit
MYAAIAAVILVAILVGVRAVEKQNLNAPTVDNTIAVRTASVIEGKIEGIVNYTGNVEGIHEAIIVSQTAGVITKLNVELGKKVGAGTVLAVIHNAQQAASVEQARAQLGVAENAQAKAKLDFERIQRLNKEKVSTQDNLEQAELNLKSANAQIKAAQAALKAAEKTLEDTYIKSTISGYIASKDMNIGETVNPGSRITQIVDVSKFKIRIMVSEIDAVKLSVGETVTVKIDALPNQKFEGKVSSIAMAAAQGMRSYPVEILISGKSDKIKSGMFARCEIYTESKDKALIVPETAVIANNDGSYNVYAFENGKAILKKVNVGIKNGGKYEIVAGLNPNSKVITDGKERIKDGLPVKEIK